MQTLLIMVGNVRFIPKIINWLIGSFFPYKSHGFYDILLIMLQSAQDSITPWLLKKYRFGFSLNYKCVTEERLK